MDMHPASVALLTFLIVMAGMAFMVAFLGVLRKAGERSARRAAGRPAAVASPPGAASGEQLDEELVAVLAAAAREVLGAPVRLYRVHVHRDGATERWSRAGRMDIMVSHRVEPKR